MSDLALSVQRAPSEREKPPLHGRAEPSYCDGEAPTVRPSRGSSSDPATPDTGALLVHFGQRREPRRCWREDV